MKIHNIALPLIIACVYNTVLGEQNIIITIKNEFSKEVTVQTDEKNFTLKPNQSNPLLYKSSNSYSSLKNAVNTAEIKTHGAWHRSIRDKFKKALEIATTHPNNHVTLTIIILNTSVLNPHFEYKISNLELPPIAPQRPTTPAPQPITKPATLQPGSYEKALITLNEQGKTSQLATVIESFIQAVKDKAYYGNDYQNKLRTIAEKNSTAYQGMNKKILSYLLYDDRGKLRTSQDGEKINDAQLKTMVQQRIIDVIYRSLR